MVSTAKHTHHATSATTAGEDEDKQKTAKELQSAFAELRKLDAQHEQERSVVKKTEAAIKGVYDRLEKQGYDRELVAFIYKQKRKNRFTTEKLITMNHYSEALGESDLPLFVVAGVKH